MEKKNQTHNRVLWLARTAMLLALLIVLQWTTKGTQAFAGQYITGSLVNCVLAIAALFSGLYSALAVAVLSPVIAAMLGIGPNVIQIIPCIALGNMVYVSLLYFLNRKAKRLWKQLVGVVCSAAAKCVVLYLAVVQFVIPITGDGFTDQMVKRFTAMFSWPQLITALVGGLLATALLPVLRKALK